MPGLRVVPSTQWVSVRGNHPGALIEVRRVTATAIYYRTIREGAGTGPRHRRGGPKNRLDHDEFLLNYRPNTKRDWMLASQPDEPASTPEGNNGHVTTTDDQAVSGRLHAEEEAIAQAIRDGVKYHDVQAQYHVQGRVLAQIIEKFGVPYETVRQKEQARATRAPEPVVEAAIPVPTEAIPDGPLHPQEEEIAELMRARAGTFQDVLRDYHVKSTTLVAIMARHGIPKQTEEEKRAKSRAYYHQKKARLEAEALAALVEAQSVPEPTPVVASAPVEASPAIVASAPIVAPPAQPGAPLHGWHVTVRTEVHMNVQAASYLEAGQAALAATAAGAEIISLVRIEGSGA
jgi:hypothetical protein